MNDFTKDFAQALFNPDKINDLLRKELPIKTLSIKYWNKSNGKNDIVFPNNGSVTRGILYDDGSFEIVDYNVDAEEL